MMSDWSTEKHLNWISELQAENVRLRAELAAEKERHGATLETLEEWMARRSQQSTTDDIVDVGINEMRWEK
jgi:hypothetical protein